MIFIEEVYKSREGRNKWCYTKGIRYEISWIMINMGGKIVK